MESVACDTFMWQVRPSSERAFQMKRGHISCASTMDAVPTPLTVARGSGTGFPDPPSCPLSVYLFVCNLHRSLPSTASLFMLSLTRPPTPTTVKRTPSVVVPGEESALLSWY